jgi:hypothetical protein
VGGRGGFGGREGDKTSIRSIFSFFLERKMGEGEERTWGPSSSTRPWWRAVRQRSCKKRERGGRTATPSFGRVVWKCGGGREDIGLLPS